MMEAYMRNKKLYSSGGAGEFCEIAKKAIHFNNKANDVQPVENLVKNRYGFPDKKLMPIIKRYQNLGFSMEEIKEVFEDASYEFIEKEFRLKIDELEKEKENANFSYTNMTDWYSRILEAEGAVENNITDVSIKYISPFNACYLEQDFNYSYLDSIINIEWIDYLEKIGKRTAGPVVLKFPDYRKKLEKRPVKVRILQKTVQECGDDLSMTLGGRLVASCYHIGPYETIGETYEKIFIWADQYGYECGKDSAERCVTDYWTSWKKDEFVTEVLIPVLKKEKRI